MSVGVVPEVSDGIVRRGLSPSGISVQPLLDRTTSLAGEKMSSKRNVAEKDKRIEALETKLHPQMLQQRLLLHRRRILCLLGLFRIWNWNFCVPV